MSKGRLAPRRSAISTRMIVKSIRTGGGLARRSVRGMSTTEKGVVVMAHSEKPVVVGVDGTDEGLRAARWAAALAVRLGAPLLLVHAIRGVDETLLVITAPQQADAGAYPRELGQAVLDRAAEAVHADFPTLRIARTLSRRSPKEALTELSRRARMVVLACAGVSAGGALLVGSTTLAVAAHSACPVIAWRGDALAPSDHPVVVGVDGNQIFHPSLTTAFAMADCLGVGLTAIYAMTARRAAGEVDIPFLVDWASLEDEARERLSDIVAPVAQHWPHVTVTCVVAMGRASRVILDHAVGAQLVVVGSRGRGELASALLGSTGLSLLHHSPAPVVICPSSCADDQSAHPEAQLVDPAPAGSS
jgi:nucleotide-binding universal stress UspA family protein